MTNSINRAVLLLQQSRFAMAEQELRRALTEDPHDARAHAMLGVTLTHLDKLDDAQAEAEQAIALAPDWPYCHFCRSIVLGQRRQFGEAEASAREAIRLDPEDADYYGRLAETLYAQGKWAEALAEAEAGLARDAEHARCSHLRTMALTKLNRKAEAIATVDQALAKDPDDAMAHANKGWALLHQREPRKALEHFREALRLEPNFEYARAGMVEALKAHNILYRWMLAYFLWMARLSPRVRWGILIGGYFGYRGLQSLAQQKPELGPWIAPLLVLYLVFAALTWFAMPLFNLMLRLNRFGRHALSRDQRVAANWFALCLVGFAAGLVGVFTVDSTVYFVLAFVSLGLALPLTTLYMCDPGWPRRTMSWFAAGMAALGLLSLVGVALAQPWSFNVFQLFVIGVIASPWAANVLVGVTPTR
jgi:tetratricopeptide (TPR) repeat protein